MAHARKLFVDLLHASCCAFTHCGNLPLLVAVCRLQEDQDDEETDERLSDHNELLHGSSPRRMRVMLSSKYFFAW